MHVFENLLYNRLLKAYERVGSVPLQELRGPLDMVVRLMPGATRQEHVALAIKFAEEAVLYPGEVSQERKDRREREALGSAAVFLCYHHPRNSILMKKYRFPRGMTETEQVQKLEKVVEQLSKQVKPTLQTPIKPTPEVAE